MNNQTEIITFIVNTFGNFSLYKELENEIDEILEFAEDESIPCSFSYVKIQNLTVVGLDFFGNRDRNALDFCFLIPNLFRQCFIKKNMPYPTGCPSYILNGTTYTNIPLLIDTELIKSFLYFNYSTNVNYDNQYINDGPFIENKIKHILNTKRSTNYGNYTQAVTIFNYIYSQDSLIKQLVNFNLVLANASYNYNNSLVGPNFYIPWTFFVYCKCVNDKIDVTLKNTKNNKMLTQLDLIYLNSIKNNKNVYKYYYNIPFVTPTENVVISNDIFVILNIALSVYEDILIQIEYFLQSKVYCPQKYMFPGNIPKLQKLYSNYVRNHNTIVNNDITTPCNSN